MTMDAVNSKPTSNELLPHQRSSLNDAPGADRRSPTPQPSLSPATKRKADAIFKKITGKILPPAIKAKLDSAAKPPASAATKGGKRQRLDTPLSSPESSLVEPSATRTNSCNGNGCSLQLECLATQLVPGFWP